MSAEHTPGPWVAQYGVDQMCHLGTTVVSMPPVSGKEQSSVFDVKARERGGRWFVFSASDTHGSAEADAHLIAAAPELLSALHIMLEDGDSTDRLQALAAIAKAEGSTP